MWHFQHLAWILLFWPCMDSVSSHTSFSVFFSLSWVEFSCWLNQRHCVCWPWCMFRVWGICFRLPYRFLHLFPPGSIFLPSLNLEMKTLIFIGRSDESGFVPRWTAFVCSAPSDHVSSRPFWWCRLTFSAAYTHWRTAPPLSWTPHVTFQLRDVGFGLFAGLWLSSSRPLSFFCCSQFV